MTSNPKNEPVGMVCEWNPGGFRSVSGLEGLCHGTKLYAHPFPSIWIKLEDELPPVNEYVILTDGKKMFAASRNNPCTSVNGEPLQFWCSSGGSGYDFEWDYEPNKMTHWTRFPKFEKLEKK
jgi:Protein of unknown function (DUF551)